MFAFEIAAPEVLHMAAEKGKFFRLAPVISAWVAPRSPAPNLLGSMAWLNLVEGFDSLIAHMASSGADDS
jgi:hypothetical protein